MDQMTFVEKVAHKISSLGLTAPAILFLEAHKPLAFLSSQLLLIAQPTLNLFVSAHSTQSMVNLLADPTQLEQLMTQLEQKTFPTLDPLETPLCHPDVQNAK